jgi:hypothetical protein
MYLPCLFVRTAIETTRVVDTTTGAAVLLTLSNRSKSSILIGYAVAAGWQAPDK